jgi:hypothetical protein
MPFENDIAYLMAAKLEAGLARSKQHQEAREEYATNVPHMQNMQQLKGSNAGAVQV